MEDSYPELDWLARRLNGESAALIAWRSGVPVRVVRAATNAYRPFPRATSQLGRTYPSPSQLDERTKRWVHARRRGQSASYIANQDETSHQYVSRLTVGHGPYPDPAIVQEWVEARHRRRSVADITAEYQAPEGTVRRETRPHGPFPQADYRRVPDGVLGVKRIAQLTGMNHPSVLRWVRTGRVPPADFVTVRGRLLWLDSTITQWLSSDALATCPECGARCVSVGQHRWGMHRFHAEQPVQSKDYE